MIGGIDEAGRGPVIGPLVVAGITIPETDIQHLKEQGVKDSKDIPKKKRNILAQQLLQRYRTHIHVISAKTITERMLEGTSLNIIEKEAMQSISTDMNTKRTVIDSPVREGSWNTQFPSHVELRHKADETYVEVGAASIIAKFTRDKYMDRLPCTCSGYPSDPKTKHVIQHATLTEPYIRYTWKTVQIEKTNRSQQNLKDFTSM